MSSRMKVIVSIVVGCVVGWNACMYWYPTPDRDRPVLSALARVVRNWWWVPLVILDDGPRPQERNASEPPPVLGFDGYPVVQHGRSI